MTGPGDVRRMPTAAASISGEVSTSSANEPTTSIVRLIAAFIRLSSGMERMPTTFRPSISSTCMRELM